MLPLGARPRAGERAGAALARARRRHPRRPDARGAREAQALLREARRPRDRRQLVRDHRRRVRAARHERGARRARSASRRSRAIARFAWAGLDPARMGLGPVYASAKALDEAGLDARRRSEAVEINEAFAAQVLACQRAFESDAFAREHLGRERALGALDLARTNLNGGAIALGHPVGATGARLLLTSAHELAVGGPRARPRDAVHRRRPGRRGRVGEDRAMIDIAGLPMPKDAPPPRACVRIERPEPGLARARARPAAPQAAPCSTCRCCATSTSRSTSSSATAELARPRDHRARRRRRSPRAPTSTRSPRSRDPRDRRARRRASGRSSSSASRGSRRAAARARPSPRSAVRCPGGAYELALACDAHRRSPTHARRRSACPRRSSASCPPGAGRQRLPRRIGVAARARGDPLGQAVRRAREALRARARRPARVRPRTWCASRATSRWAARRRARVRGGCVGGPRRPQSARARGFIASAAREQVLDARRTATTRRRSRALEIVARAPRTPLEQGLRAPRRDAVEPLAVAPTSQEPDRDLPLLGGGEEARASSPDGTAARRASERARRARRGRDGRARSRACSPSAASSTRLFDVVPRSARRGARRAPRATSTETR